MEEYFVPSKCCPTSSSHEVHEFKKKDSKGREIHCQPKGLLGTQKAVCDLGRLHRRRYLCLSGPV